LHTAIRNCDKVWHQIFFSDDTVKSTHEFESSPQSKDPELTPEEEVNPDLMAEGGFSEANYSLGEVISNREAVASVEPPPAASTPHQNDSMLPSSEPQQSNSGYDSYLVGPPPVSPFSRRSPVFPSSSLFQVIVSAFFISVKEICPNLKLEILKVRREKCHAC
jgi:hypothetical protein